MLRAGSPTKEALRLVGAVLRRMRRMYPLELEERMSWMGGRGETRVSQVIISALEWEDASISRGQWCPRDPVADFQREEDQEQDLYPRSVPVLPESLTVSYSFPPTAGYGGLAKGGQHSGPSWNQSRFDLGKED